MSYLVFVSALFLLTSEVTSNSEGCKQNQLNYAEEEKPADMTCCKQQFWFEQWNLVTLSQDSDLMGVHSVNVSAAGMGLDNNDA